VQAAIKAINNMPEQRANGKQDGVARANNVENMLQVSECVISAFQSLASKDETEASILTRSLKRPGVKAAAFLGTSAGTLLAEPRAKSAVQHK
jgi:putative NADH-flavin reductase